jgi:hypothetical protein
MPLDDIIPEKIKNREDKIEFTTLKELALIQEDKTFFKYNNCRNNYCY